jgi:hypothetical protein
MARKPRADIYRKVLDSRKRRVRGPELPVDFAKKERCSAQLYHSFGIIHP